MKPTKFAFAWSHSSPPVWATPGPSVQLINALLYRRFIIVPPSKLFLHFYYSEVFSEEMLHQEINYAADAKKMYPELFIALSMIIFLLYYLLSPSSPLKVI